MLASYDDVLSIHSRHAALMTLTASKACWCAHQSEELSHIHIRRGQKMVLNLINQRKRDNEVQYHVPEEGRRERPCKAIKTAAEKIVILVRPSRKRSGGFLNLNVAARQRIATGVDCCKPSFKVF